MGGRTRLMTAVGMVLAFAVLVPGPASAQLQPCSPGQTPGRPSDTPPGRPPQYPPGLCQLSVSPTTAGPGSTANVAGDGFAPGQQVVVTIAEFRVGVATANAAGSFTASVIVPSVAPGSHEVRSSGPGAGGGTHVLSATLTVTGPTGTESPRSLGETLPRTGVGDTVEPLTALAGVLVLLGAIAVVGTRRRHRAPSA